VIERLIGRISQELKAAQIPYMMIGGQAVLVYGRPRLTRDIDITLGIDTADFSRAEAICAKLGLRMLSDSPREFAHRTKVLPAEDPASKIRVDFIFSFTPYETQAIERAKTVPVAGHPVAFATCEDLIIHKMVAGRPVDHEDVRHLLAKNGTHLDLGYIRQWLVQFSEIPGYERVTPDFEALLRE